MKEIRISQNKIVLVDDEDFDLVIEYNWSVLCVKNTYYAYRKEKGTRKTILMHRQIMNTPDNLLCDHEDHNGLNNQKINLRNCTRSQNNANRVSNGKSKYLGVSKNRNSFMAQISINKKTKYLGTFKNEIDAAKQYDIAAKLYYKEFANLNFKDNDINETNR